MARQLRIEFNGAFYHITSRGNLKGRIFYDDKGRGRRIVIYLSKVLSGKKNVEVGSFFGIKGPAVSGAIKAIEERLDKEKKLKKEIEGLKENLINE